MISENYKKKCFSIEPFLYLTLWIRASAKCHKCKQLNTRQENWQEVLVRIRFCSTSRALMRSWNFDDRSSFREYGSIAQQPSEGCLKPKLGSKCRCSFLLAMLCYGDYTSCSSESDVGTLFTVDFCVLRCCLCSFYHPFLSYVPLLF